MSINILPKVSIITPVFNLIKDGRKEFVKEMLESVHNQTYKNIEHIIQDGASTDGTVELLKEYEKKGWIKLYSEKDQNVHDAINKAVEKATGKYIAILSSDDYYKDKDIVEDVVVNYLEKEQADYSYGDEERICVKDGHFINIWKGDAHLFEFWRGNSFNTETMFFKKEIFDEIGGFDIEYASTSDLKLQIKIRIANYRGIYIPKIIDVFRVGKGISTGNELMFQKNEFAKICHELWKQFDDSLTCERVEYMIKYNNYSELFLMSLRRFIIDKKLKNFDYIGFNNYIEKKINNINKISYKLFNFITLIKIKIKKGRKTYMLFNLLPILVVKKNF